MIKLILLTGFLGTGKTTLLKEMLNAFKSQKIGVIVNEFGEINIDGALIDREGLQMKELSNGSIFCACIKDNFINSLIAMSGEDISILYIEASGLADPSNMAQILNSISSRCKKQYCYSGSICIADAETFIDYCDLLPALHQQVAYSGIIIVNKADLASDDQLKEVLEKLSSINSRAAVYVTSYCRVDYKEVVNKLFVPDIQGTESSNTIESRPKTFILKSEDILPYDELGTYIKNLSAYAYRIKGFARTTKGNVLISAVKNRLDITPWPEDIEETDIVVISAIGIRIVSLITEGLKDELKGRLHM